MHKFKHRWLLPILICGAAVSCAGYHVNGGQGVLDQRFDNIIVLVPDGCGVAHMTVSRWFKGTPLTQDSMAVTLVRTHSANSMITGSAAAFATGFKSWEDPDKAACLSIRPDSVLIPEPRPLVLVFPDHECGGMTLGNQDIDAYSFRPENMVSVINKARLSAEGVATLMRNLGSDGDAAGIREVMSRYCGIDDLSDRELILLRQELADSVDGYLNPVLGTMVSQRCGIGWTTGAHTGTDVPMFSYGFRSVPQTIDNTEIARLCAQAMGFDLGAVTERLFVDAGVLFDDATVLIDTAGVGNSGGQLIVERDGKTARFPFFKNIMVAKEDTSLLEGLTVYSLKAHTVYLPRQARKLFDAFE